jgi:hypothetical protein
MVCHVNNGLFQTKCYTQIVTVTTAKIYSVFTVAIEASSASTLTYVHLAYIFKNFPGWGCEGPLFTAGRGNEGGRVTVEGRVREGRGEDGNVQSKQNLRITPWIMVDQCVKCGRRQHVCGIMG